VVLVPLPPAVRRAVDRAVDGRDSGPILRNTRGARKNLDRHPNDILAAYMASGT
jgi:integrase/recombinase XerD